MKKHLLMLSVLFLFLATVVVSSHAAAQNQTNTQTRPVMKCQQRFQSMDTNHDGKVTKKEFMAARHNRRYAEKVFESMANGKDYITEEEFCAKKGRHGRRGAGRGGPQ